MKAFRCIALLVCLAAQTWAASELTGEWRSTDGTETQAYTADGHFTAIAHGVGVQGTYECRGDVVVLHFSSDGAPPQVMRKFTVEGDTLRLEDPASHRSVVLKRVPQKKH